VFCGRFWGSITPSTRSEPAKTSKVYLLEMLHTTNKDEEKFLFLVEFFHIEIFMKKVDLDDHFKMLMLRFGYLGKWCPCAYESLSTKGEDYYPHTLLYDFNFTLT
jgi:hypothetical protein